MIATRFGRSLGLLLAAALGATGPLAAVTIVQGAEHAQPAFRTIDSAQLAGMLAHKDFVLVNVHIPYEGEIAQTDALIPFDRIGQSLDRLPSDKDAAIVLYCRSGRMSEIAAKSLVALGYTNVSHLAGGMIAWERAGYELVRRGQPA